MKKEPEVIKFDITWISVLRVVAVILGLFFVFLVRDIIALIFVVFIIVAALSPFVLRLEKSMPRVLAVVLIYLLLLLIISLLSIIVFGPLAKQVNQLATIIPNTVSVYLDSLQGLRSSESEINSFIQNGLSTFSQKLSSLTGNVIQTIFSVFGGVVTAVTVIILSFYLLLEERSAKKTLDSILPPDQRERAYTILRKFSEKMGAWVRGQLVLMLFIGIIDFVILTIFKVPGALALGIWGGLTELIPYVGPVLGAIPAIAVAWSSGGIVVALILGLIMIVLVQWIEGQLLVPNVMKKAVGLSPVIIIIALLIGGKLMGIVGIVLAVPVAALLSVVIQEWENIKKIYNNEL